MAGSGRKVWTNETLSAPDMQNYLQDQTLMVFASAAARSAGIPAPTEGMATYLADLDRVDVYMAGPTGALGWQPLSIASWPAAMLRATAAQGPLAVNTYTDLTFGVADLDTHAGWAASPNPARWTCPPGQAGIYRVKGVLSAVGSGSAMAGFAQLAKNGTALAGSNGPGGTYAGGGTLLAATNDMLIALVPTDYVTVRGFTSAANWLTQVGSTNASTLTVERVR